MASRFGQSIIDLNRQQMKLFNEQLKGRRGEVPQPIVMMPSCIFAVNIRTFG